MITRNIYRVSGKKSQKRYGKCIVKVMIHFKSIVNTHYSKECYKIAEEIMIRKSDIVILFGFSESIRYYSDFYNIPLIIPD